MANDIGPKIGLQGEKEFQNAIKDINRNLKLLDSEMKVVTSEFDRNDKSMEALTKQNDAYKKKVDELNQKLKLQGDQLERAKEVYKDQPEYIEELQTAYNKTQVEINKLNLKIKKNNEEMQQNSKLTEVAGKAMKGFATVAAASAVALAAAAAAALKIGKSLANMALEAGKAADELTTLSAQTGLSTDELQKYQFAADRIDVSVETITGSMTKLTRSMSSASKGSKTTSQAFAKLGITITDSNGELRDRNEVFRETINALGKIENVTERDAVAMELFGKSAQELNPLILGGADALDEFGKEAEKAGLVLSSSQLQNLNVLNDAVDRFKTTWSSAKMLFASTFSADMGQTIDLITDAVQRLTKAFSEGGIEGALKELPKIVEDLAGDLKERIAKFGEIGGELIKALAKGISIMAPELVPAAIEALGVFVDAILEPDTLQTVLEAAGTVVIKFVEGVIKNLPMIVTTALQLIRELVSTMAKAIFNLIPPEGRQLIENFIKGIKEWWENLKKTGRDIIEKTKEGVTERLTEAKNWGRDLIDSFSAGIRAKWDSLKTTMRNTGNIVKNFLGFSEPKEGPLSNFHTYAPDMIKLYAKGITDKAWRVQNAVNGVAQDMTFSADASFASRAASNEGMKIYLSTGQLVGGIAPYMNNTLGYAYVQDVRGAMA